MIRTRLTDLLGVRNPVVLGGMGNATSVDLVVAVANAGGLAVHGATSRSPDQIAEHVAAIRARTDGVFGLNFLLAFLEEERFAAALAARPPVLSFAWPWADQDLRPYFDRAHEVGAKVMHMISTAAEARRAVEAGADLIVAQGTEGGGHVGLMGTLALVPLVVDAVGEVPVLAAGGVADGRGLVAALALGAEGILLGTRFLATPEAPVPEAYKQAIVDCDGSNTLLTEIPDIASGRVWPGAWSRVIRNRFIETWAGREDELRRQRGNASRAIEAARQRGEIDQVPIFAGQSTGLIRDIRPAGEVVEQIVVEAEAILSERLAGRLEGAEVRRGGPA